MPTIPEIPVRQSPLYPLAVELCCEHDLKTCPLRAWRGIPFKERLKVISLLSEPEAVDLSLRAARCEWTQHHWRPFSELATKPKYRQSDED